MAASTKSDGISRLFCKGGHEIVPFFAARSAQRSTLMFTNAGMVQFKNVFTGAKAALPARGDGAEMRARRRQAQRPGQRAIRRATTPSSKCWEFLVRRLLQERAIELGLEPGNQGLRPVEGTG